MQPRGGALSLERRALWLEMFTKAAHFFCLRIRIVLLCLVFSSVSGT